MIELRATGVERHEGQTSQQKQHDPQDDGADFLPRRVAGGGLHNQAETICKQKRESERESGVQIQPYEKQRWYPKQKSGPSFFIFIAAFEFIGAFEQP